MEVAMKRRTALALFVLTLGCLVGPGLCARAQDDPGMPPDTAAIFDSIDDIDKLRLLNPLGLTAQQLDKIIPMLTARQRAYNARILELAVEPLKAIAPDIKATRSKLLVGGAIPNDIDEKIKRLQKEFADRRTQEQDKNLKLVADGIRSVLTTAQYKAVVATSRRDFTGKEGTDEQFFNLWVRETVVAYPRIVPLLEDMRKARAPKESSPKAL